MAPYPVVNGFTYLTPHVIQIMELSRYYLVVVLVFHSQSSQTQEKEVKSVRCLVSKTAPVSYRSFWVRSTR